MFFCAYKVHHHNTETTFVQKYANRLKKLTLLNQHINKQKQRAPSLFFQTRTQQDVPYSCLPCSRLPRPRQEVRVCGQGHCTVPPAWHLQTVYPPELRSYGGDRI